MRSTPTLTTRPSTLGLRLVLTVTIAFVAFGCGDRGETTPQRVYITQKQLPESARYMFVLEVPPTPPDNVTVFLSRFDIMATDLPALARMQPHLPDPKDLKESKKLMTALTAHRPKATWWVPEKLSEPRCARKMGQTVPSPPKKQKNGETDADEPDATPDPDDGLTVDVDDPETTPADEQTWMVTMAVGKLPAGRVRVYILLIEEPALPAPGEPPGPPTLLTPPPDPKYDGKTNATN